MFVEMKTMNFVNEFRTREAVSGSGESIQKKNRGKQTAVKSTY